LRILLSVPGDVMTGVIGIWHFSKNLLAY